MRISDGNETALSLSTQTEAKSLKKKASAKAQAGLWAIMRRRGWNTDAMCISYVCFEGSKAEVDARRKAVAAVAKKHPGAAKHLDSKVVLDSLWDALTDAVNAPAPVPTPAPVVQPAPVVVAEPIKPAPAPRADNDGNVVGVTARPAPTLSTHRFA